MTELELVETVKFISNCSDTEFSRLKKFLTEQRRQNRIPFAEEIQREEAA